MKKIAEVILPLAVRSNFSYLIPPEMQAEAQVGKRVLVPFGKNKIYTGIIREVSVVAPGVETYGLKTVEEVLDTQPLLAKSHLDLFDWIATYYMCTPGEVIKAALPTGLKPESALRISLPDGATGFPEESANEVDDRAFLLLDALSIQPVMTLEEAAAVMGMRNPMQRLKRMEAAGLVKVFQEVEETYRQKSVVLLELAPDYQSNDRLEAAFESIAGKQGLEDLLLLLTTAHYQGESLKRSEVLKRKGITAVSVKKLMEKGFIVEKKKVIDRLMDSGLAKPEPITLNAAQEAALEEIRASIAQNPSKPILLHGVTGSGKTHVYLSLIRDVIARGQKVLYLLPEITLTKQIIERVRGELGKGVGIYHSRFSDAERVEIWHKVRDQAYDVVIGVRSAIFLPMANLGLIIVDEEHDGSFKQQEPSPRYNARDTAVYYAHKLGIPVVLGSATPSLESYFNAEANRYTRVVLDKRALDGRLPDLEVIDLNAWRKQKAMEGPFSPPLIQAIKETLERKEQVILFQNRRGYAPMLVCGNCGHVPQCIHCDISLTYHKDKNHLRCHYCGYIDFRLNPCQSCGHHALRISGAGTERIEEQAAKLFPDHKVARMDFDTTRGKVRFGQLIQDFEEGRTDILVGTQMVSKGLDFEKVTLVGVMNADGLLSFPDFRASENALQMLMQVSGRAGRRERPGRVMIQTSNPEHPVLKMLTLPFSRFYLDEAPHRKTLHYPPFVRLIRIEMRNPESEQVEQEAARLGMILRERMGGAVLGPDYALVARVRNQYRMQFLIKIARSQDPAAVRAILHEAIDTYLTLAPKKNTRIMVDVDPV